MLVGWLLCLFISASLTAQNPFEKTPFYSIPVIDTELKQVQIKEDSTAKYPLLKQEKKKAFTLMVNKTHLDYYNKLSDFDKKVFIKLTSLNMFKNIDLKNKRYLTEQYSLLYKRDRAFNLETLAIIPLDYKTARPLITDYASYNDWVLKDINVRRDGEKGRYFVDINSLRLFTEKTPDNKEQRIFDTRVSLRIFAKGEYRLDLLILDFTDAEPIPYYTLKMTAPSKLARNVEGTFRFIVLPGLPYFLVYFTGKSELSWAFYSFLPLALVRSQVLERVYTLMENMQYRAESLPKKEVCSDEDKNPNKNTNKKLTKTIKSGIM